MMEFKENKSLLSLLIFLLSGFLAVLIASNVVGIQNKIKEGKYIGRSPALRDTITVSGKGDVYAKPDLAVIAFSVITESKTVAESLTDNAKKMNAVIESIKNQGVESKDLKTTNFNIVPRYEWSERSEFYPSSKRTLVGYEVSQSLEVKIRNLEKVGPIIELAGQAGANQAGDLQFTIDNQDNLKKEAREQAIAKAKEQAQELAGQLGVKLVRIANFSESGGPFPIFFGAEKNMGMGGGGATPQIETGENKIEVTVSITYEID